MQAAFWAAVMWISKVLGEMAGNGGFLHIGQLLFQIFLLFPRRKQGQIIPFLVTGHLKDGGLVVDHVPGDLNGVHLKQQEHAQEACDSHHAHQGKQQQKPPGTFAHWLARPVLRRVSPPG